MAARLAALLPRLAALTVIWLLATSTITFAAGGRQNVSPKATAPPAEAGPSIVVVPDVRRQAYVFAKGILDDAGFAWRVEGPVAAYAVNTVSSQSPAPGTRVVDTGAPTIVLRLERNTSYDERGLPESESPYAGTKIVLPSEVEKQAPAAAPAEKAPAGDGAVAETPAVAGDGAPDSEPAKKERAPDFAVPGAPAEPSDEMPLPDRARLLERRIAGQKRPTPALARYWLYQHSWIVAGARFGWHDGAEALRTLIRVDRDLQVRWGFGAKSEAIARAALAEVERRAGK